MLLMIKKTRRLTSLQAKTEASCTYTVFLKIAATPELLSVTILYFKSVKKSSTNWLSFYICFLNYSLVTLAACGPRAPSTTSKDTS